jgi:hypothetical protein
MAGEDVAQPVPNEYLDLNEPHRAAPALGAGPQVEGADAEQQIPAEQLPAEPGDGDGEEDQDDDAFLQELEEMHPQQEDEPLDGDEVTPETEQPPEEAPPPTTTPPHYPSSQGAPREFGPLGHVRTVEKEPENEFESRREARHRQERSQEERKRWPRGVLQK